MANRIKGITVEIGGDTTSLEKALRDTNRTISTTQSELRDVERLLKLDPKNVTLLEQKQKLLNTQVAGTNKKLETLRTASEQAGAAMQQGVQGAEKQYDALQREIVETEQQLRVLQDRQRDTQNDLNDVPLTLDAIGDKAEDLTKKTKTLSTYAGKAVSKLWELAVNAGGAADDLNTLAKQTGFSAEELQRWQYAADIVDVSVDDIVSAASRMKRNMDSTSEDVVAAWARLGVAPIDAEGNYRNATEVFYETLDALSQIPNETERDVVAMELFGRGADHLAGIVDDGGEALRALGDEAVAVGAVLSQDALDGANALNDGVDRLKARTQTAMLELGAAVADDLLPVLDDLVEMITKVLDWIGKLNDRQLRLLESLLLIAAAIGPLTSGIGNIISVIERVAKIWSSFNIETAGTIAALGILINLVSDLAGAWDKMTGAQKVVGVLGSLSAAAGAAAIAFGALQSVLSAGLAIAAIVAGIVAVTAAVNSAVKSDHPEPIEVVGGSGGTNRYYSEPSQEPGAGTAWEERSLFVKYDRRPPQLADGAVLYPNRPFLAMVGDQRSGVNVEAPMATIKQGVREVISERGGATNVNVRFTGSLSQLARVLKPEIDAEGARVGASARGVTGC